MKKATPLSDGMALTNYLYGTTPTSVNIAIPSIENKPLDRPPSLIPGVKYPITDGEQEIINLTWHHCRKMEGF